MVSSDYRELEFIFSRSKTIAVVGLSPKPEKKSHGVAAYLLRHGYRIIPVNPHAEKVLGKRACPDLNQIPVAVDVVQFFRKSEAVPSIVDEAIEIGAKVVWMQIGIQHEEAAKKAEEAGLSVIMNAYMRATHRKLGLADP